MPPAEHSEWRFTISEIGGEQARHGFGNLEGLVIFLLEKVMHEESKDHSKVQ
jgi:hypothetical protein